MRRRGRKGLSESVQTLWCGAVGDGAREERGRWRLVSDGRRGFMCVELDWSIMSARVKANMS